MTENPHRDGRIRTDDPRHPKAPEGDRGRPSVADNGVAVRAGEDGDGRPKPHVDTGCGHSGVHTDEYEFTNAELLREVESAVAEYRSWPEWLRSPRASPSRPLRARRRRTVTGERPSPSAWPRGSVVGESWMRAIERAERSSAAETIYDLAREMAARLDAIVREINSDEQAAAADEFLTAQAQTLGLIRDMASGAVEVRRA